MYYNNQLFIMAVLQTCMAEQQKVCLCRTVECGITGISLLYQTGFERNKIEKIDIRGKTSKE